MTNQKHLPADISSLWRYPDGISVIRYLDINEAARLKFALIVKYWAPQNRLRIKPIDDIQGLLAEINPILFSSRPSNTRTKGSCPFAHSSTLDPWRWRLLTKVLYRLLCTSTKNIHIDYVLQLTSLHDDTSYSIQEALRTTLNTQMRTAETPTTLPSPTDITMNKLREMDLHHNNRLAMEDAASMRYAYSPTPQQPRPIRLNVSPDMFLLDDNDNSPL